METPPPDWDLLAVVRSCCTTNSATTSTTTPTVVPTVDLSLPPPPPPLQPPLFNFPNVNPFITSPSQDLQDIFNPLITTTTTTATTTTTTTTPTTTCSSTIMNNNNNNTSFQPSISSSSSFISTRSFGITEQTHHQQLRRMIKPTQVVFGAPRVSSTSTTSSNSQGQRGKKRKNLMKKVCHVPVEGLSNDMWAWRKYGQKPIKGSPYPRGYYRCSSSKGCLARKQVERNRSDPKMFIVTYTSEHNHPMPTHRNSLAGSTRQKPATTTTSTTTPDNPTCSSPSDNSLSPLTESKTEHDEMKEDNGEENDQMGISELILEDDFYVGFEQIDGDDGSDGFSDRFSPSTEFLWLGSSGNTVTAAGGS